MPPMQLKRLVLPAPLGPMSAINSPASALKETSRSTWSPPKASETLRTSSSAMVRLRQSFCARVAIAATRSVPPAEIICLDMRIRTHARAVALQRDLAILQHVGVIRDLQGDHRIL